MNYQVMTNRFLLIALLLFLPCVASAYDEIGLDENNEFGGKTIFFQAPERGIFRGQDFYDSGGNIMRQDWKFSEESSLARGVARKVSEFLFDIKTKETIYYTPKYQILRMVSHQVDHFEQATGTIIRREKYFAQKKMGYSVTFMEFGKRIKLEWHYPDNLEGYAKVITYYDEKGIKPVKIENFFTPRTTMLTGQIRSVYIEKGGKKVRREWYYSPVWGKKNKGARMKVIDYLHHPSQEIPPQVNYLDADKERIELDKETAL
ncbi:MAG: hypothetical protein QNL04_03960 [SAR324 cluster bacterium]|nr:hypothetical protein [SAR324 cluster bacterium]